MEPCCDSDEEIFIGPLTVKEIRKALTLRRRTEIFEPMSELTEVKAMGSQPEVIDENNKLTPRQSCSSLEESEECVTPAPPPSPEHAEYIGSPYPTPGPYRTKLSSSLAGIAEEIGFPPQSTPKTDSQCVYFPRFSDFGSWRDCHAISYSSEVSSQLDGDVSSLSISQDTRTREILISKMREHEKKTQKLKNTRKYVDDESNQSMDLSTDADKPTRFSRLISERSARGDFLDDLERRYGKDKLTTITDKQESPPEPVDIPVPHVIVTGNYSLISEAEEEKSISEIKADEDGGYLSVLSEAAMYHALLKLPQGQQDSSKSPQENLSKSSFEENLFKSSFQENLSKSFHENLSKESQENLFKPPSLENLSKSCFQENLSKTSQENLAKTYQENLFKPPSQENLSKSSLQENLSKSSSEENLSHLAESLVDINSESSDDSIVVILNNRNGREIDAREDLNESDIKKLKDLNSSKEFDDTLEEMELMLQLGIDYITDGKNLEDVNELCDVIPAVVKPTSKIPQMKANSQKLQAVVSPIVRVKTSPFKVPTKPLSSKKTPGKKMGQYDKIVSPVSAYIHNTPAPSLVKNVKPRTTPKRCRDFISNDSESFHRASLATLLKMLFTEGSETSSSNGGLPTGELNGNKPRRHCRARPIHRYRPRPSNPEVVWQGIENINTMNVLPVVVHHSVPSVKLEQHTGERMPRMNEKMKKLVDTPRPHVMKHEGRVKVTSNPGARRVLCHNTSSAEISVLVDKQASRTNTLRK